MAAWTSSGDEADLSGLRGDLRERLTAIRIDLPPLRQRPDDIPLLATHFLKEACQQHGVAMKTLTRPALTLLAALPWRENARGLRTLVDRLAQMTPSGLVRLEDVLVHFRLDGDFGPATETLRDAKMRFEREYIGTVLRQHRGRMGETAASLGIQRTNLYRKVRQHKLGTSRPGRTDR
jgi:DNA-binding NtrC family response regulator